MRAGLFSEIKNNPWALALVFIAHVCIIVLLSINLFDHDKPATPRAQQQNIIVAVAVDAKKYDEREKQKKLAVKKVDDEKALEEKRQLDAQKKREEENLADKIAAKKAEEKKLQAAQQRIAAEKKKEQEKLANEKLIAEKKAADKKAAEDKAAAKKEQEKKELERLEAEKKRKAEEVLKRRAEEKAELERAMFEEERRREEAKKQAEYAALVQTQRAQYVMLITQKIQSNWLRPVTTTEGLSCDVIVTQTMTGDVISVRLQSCNNNDIAFQRSVESAVYKAAPLPLPPNPDVFDKVIQFNFKAH